MVTSKRNRKQKEQNKNITAAPARQAKDSAASALACDAPIGRLNREHACKRKRGSTPVTIVLRQMPRDGRHNGKLPTHHRGEKEYPTWRERESRFLPRVCGRAVIL
ncbi:hypothetical protein [Bradyrhizobium elkanii]|uniref:hypothetical protein n=1 Tax=Bradyrhizobium elkanii TaxID=29448 RepID=UPI001BADDE07|nr:hypothetical protein [Bradyrhizobium elkanii]MBR1158125.1 hypothetical protein [Bradyrhizobium elkanii]